MIAIVAARRRGVYPTVLLGGANIPVKLQAQIVALQNLSELDRRLRDMETELAHEGQVLAEQRARLEQLKKQFETTQTTVGDMERTRAELLQDARQMSLQMDRSREKLARSRTEREVNASQREIEELRKLYRDREIEIDKLNHLSDQARVDMDGVSARQGELSKAMSEKESELGDRLSQLESALAVARAQRGELVAAVPKPLYRRYELVRKRRGNALAWTAEGTCSECHMAVSPMMFQKLRRSETLDTCPSCQRILYFVASSPEGEDEAVAEPAPPGPA